MMTSAQFVERVERGLQKALAASALPAPGVKVGVALSGGADSVALLAAMREAGWDCVALHCNFHLRGPASDHDERFSRDVARKLGADILVAAFDTSAYARQHGLSIEMAARELRYGFFAATAQQMRLGFVAIGHHRDDNIETLWLNLLRGSGLNGAAAIRPARKDLATDTLYVRPLLGVAKGEILEYLNAKGLDYVTDATNFENDVKRNRLRNLVLPALDSAFPEARQGLVASLECLASDRLLLEDLMAEKAAKYVSQSGEILLSRLLSEERHPAAVLFHLLQILYPQAAFALPTVEKMLENTHSGRIFEAAGGVRLLFDRGRLRPLPQEDENTPAEDITFHLDDDQRIQLSENEWISVEKLPIADFHPTRNASTLWLGQNAGGQSFTLRHPLKGERLKCFGLRGSKLLSDLYTEAHLPLDAKSRQWVLADSDGRIVWAVGLRPSAHWPVSPLLHTAFFRLTLHQK